MCSLFGSKIPAFLTTYAAIDYRGGVIYQVVLLVVVDEQVSVFLFFHLFRQFLIKDFLCNKYCKSYYISYFALQSMNRLINIRLIYKHTTTTISMNI